MNKIAILHYASPPIIGGVESTIYHHARLLSEAGFKVEVLAGRGEHFQPLTAFHQIDEIDSRQPEPSKVVQELVKGHVTPAFEDLADRLFHRISELLTGTAVLIVHNAISLHKNLALTAALHRFSREGVTPIIAWCHDFAWQDPLYIPELHQGYPWDLLKTPWPGVVYVAVSKHRRERLAELLGLPLEEIRVITPGVDQEAFLGIGPATRHLVKQLKVFESEPLGLLPARITRRKNIEFAIRVIAALQRHKPNPMLLVTGPPGPHNPKNAAYLESLKKLRSSLGVEKSIQFLYEQGENGQPWNLAGEVVADLYRVADFLLFPSTSEGFGIPVLEAGLARLPVFAADIPPVRESAASHACLFDPAGDPQEVARRILEKLDKDQAYQLRRRVLSTFTWEAILKKEIVPLIQEVGR
jgi:mannosylglucosylglycerate synthase